MSKRRPFGERVECALRIPRIGQFARRLASMCDQDAVVLDLGCGERSPIGEAVGGLRTIGIDGDADALQRARQRGTHADYIKANLLLDFSEVKTAVANENVQLVVLAHVVEHLPKEGGFELLTRAEQLSGRFVLIETPNGFLPQGPEYGSELQRHLSGWFPHDFEGLGYEVHGTAGTKYLRGYAGSPRVSRRGGQSLDFLLARMLWIERFPRHAFSLLAWKDMRGIEARLG
jgi:hypothetical protein